MALTIAQELIDAGTKYKKELLAMPVAVLAKIFPFFNLATGIQGKTSGGVLTVDAQLRPYRTAKDAAGSVAIDPYEWETFLGDVVQEFDPNTLLGTLYTEATALKGDKTKIAKLVAMEMAKKIGENLYNAMFTATRNASGDTSADLFNGYATQIAALITAGDISVANGNLLDLSSTPMTADNCGDQLKQFFRGAEQLLKDANSFMYMPTSIREMYEDWYQVEYGHAPWNAQFAQRKLIGTEDKCSIASLGNMGGTSYIILSLKENMKIGVDQMSDAEDVEIRRVDNPKVVQLFMKASFGVGLETVDKRVFKVLKYATA